MDPISSGNEESRDLNSAIISFLPEAKANATTIINHKGVEYHALQRKEGKY